MENGNYCNKTQEQIQQKMEKIIEEGDILFDIQKSIYNLITGGNDDDLAKDMTDIFFAKHCKSNPLSRN